MPMYNLQGIIIIIQKNLQNVKITEKVCNERPIIDSKSFKFKVTITRKTPGDGNKTDVETSFHENT